MLPAKIKLAGRENATMVWQWHLETGSLHFLDQSFTEF